MVEINIVYQGELRTQSTHPSGATITTDAPVDNHGRGESFSPTDLMATALGTCMVTIMGIAAKKMAIDITGTTVVVQKEMVTIPIRRIGKLATVITVPLSLTDEQKQKLIHAAEICPVHQSMHPDVALPIEFRWA